MAVIVTFSNHYKFQKDKGRIDLSADSIIVILMDAAFSFDEDTHATLADVTANQLATGNGYTQDNKLVTGQVLTEDDPNNRSYLAMDFITFIAAGGTIGPTGAAVFYDATTADKTVICGVDFGTDHTITTDGLQLQNFIIEST